MHHLAQENKRLSATMETLKDHLAEAEDRLGNMKLQASVKEVNHNYAYPVYIIMLIKSLLFSPPLYSPRYVR